MLSQISSIKIIRHMLLHLNNMQNDTMKRNVTQNNHIKYYVLRSSSTSFTPGSEILQDLKLSKSSSQPELFQAGQELRLHLHIGQLP